VPVPNNLKSLSAYSYSGQILSAPIQHALCSFVLAGTHPTCKTRQFQSEREVFTLKIDKKIYGFIEHELYHYKQYKEDLILERERILHASPAPPDGMPKGRTVSNIPLEKTIALNESTCILHMERTIRAVDNALKRVTDIHRRLFEEYYVKMRDDKYVLCDDLGMSYETFKRYKQKLIILTGCELGVISLSRI